MKHLTCIWLVVSFLITITYSGFSQPSPKEKTEIMVLGVYHFNNPGQDTYNISTDNYFTKKRQSEIEHVVDLLAEFKPTKILLERLPEEQTKLDSLFDLYTNDDLALNSIKGGESEVYQLGFRIGKKLSLPSITAVDHPGIWLGDYIDFIADTLEVDNYNNYVSAEIKAVRDREQLFLKQSVKDNLIYINDWQQILANHHYYNNIAIAVKDTTNVLFSYQENKEDIDGLPYLLRSYDFNNIGVEMTAEWYKRNLFIYRNILENTSKGDKVMVIFGSGHVRYLHQLLKDNPSFEVIPPNRFLER